MFDLENAIRKWKRSLRKSPYFEDADIEEFETHLRDEIESQIDSGNSIPEAFRNSINKIGDPDSIGKEIYYSRRKAYTFGNLFSFNLPLLSNQIRVSLRKMKKNHGFTLINVVGLTLGLSVCFMIYLFISDELSFDKFNTFSERIYRLENKVTESESGNIRHESRVPITWAPEVKKDYPEINKATRICVSRESVLVRIKDDTFREGVFCYADNEIFDIFSLEISSGDRSTPLERPNTMVISESQAEKFFGDQDPIGKRITVEIGWYGEVEYEITAMVKDIPRNSHFRADMFFSFPTLSEQIFQDINQDRYIHFYYTYLLLDPDTDAQILESKLSPFINRHYEKETAERYDIELVNLNDIYFHTDPITAIGETSNFNKIRIFSAIAIFILCIALFNYINLSTAQSLDKSKETGIRKVVGADRFSLIKQYLTESIVFCFISSLIALVFCYGILSYFNQLTGKELSIDISTLIPIIPYWIILVLVAGILAGLYPAFLLSSFKPSVIFKGLSSSGEKTRLFRNMLVGLQFGISSVLIIATIVVYKQLEFLHNKNLGYEKEGILEINLLSPEMRQNYKTLKKEINNLGIVEASAATTHPPSSELYYFGYRFHALENIPDLIHMARFHIDHDFFNLMNIPLIAGTYPDESFDNDSSEMVIVNKAALSELNLRNPEDIIGQRVTFERSNGAVISASVVAVCENFHWESLHFEIEPMVLDFWAEDFNYLYVRTSGINKSVIKTIENTYKNVYPEDPFEFSFLNEHINELYVRENKMGKLFLAFTLLAIMISGLGLFGVSVYTIERKTKEIGIRKVFGAGKWQITFTLTSRLLKLVLISFVVSAPFAFYIMSQWLENFAFKIRIGLDVFLYTSIFLLLITILTIGWQSFRAGQLNPARSLRME